MSNNPHNKFSRPSNPPPQIFFNEEERNFVKQIADEVIESTIGQQIAYFPLNTQKTEFHPLYGEAIHKVFYPSVRIYVAVEWMDYDVKVDYEGIDKKPNLIVHFHKRRITEDQELFVQEGDFLSYGNDFYELVKVGEPRELFGKVEHKFEFSAVCRKARKGQFEVFEG